MNDQLKQLQETAERLGQSWKLIAPPISMLLSPLQQAQMSQAAEFQALATGVMVQYNLRGAYSQQEVMAACKEVCSHCPENPIQTMRTLAIAGDKKLTRDFIRELAKVTSKEQP